MPLSTSQRLTGLVTATHTPLHSDGSLNLAVVERQAAHLLGHGIETVFIGGSTGESTSLTTAERRALAERWFAVAAGTSMKIVVHVGANCLADARELATHAEQLGATAIAAVAPSYFKPRDIDTLVATMAHLAAAAPATPFYHYDIPALTGMSQSMPDFLAQAGTRIPTLAGMKFTNGDLMAYQFLLRADGGKWDILYGCDEQFLGALAMGGQSAVGSGFNFAAPVYQRLLRAFHAGDLATAREEQWRGVQLIRLFASYGYMGATKAAMGMLGIEVGPPRLPNATLTPEQTAKLRAELEAMGFFDRVK